MVLGITGCPGSGKSKLAEFLAENGWTLVDADRIGREVVENDTGILDKLADAFGRDILDENGALKRRVLASRAFSKSESTRTLNAIVHPSLIERLRHTVGGFGRFELNVVVDCALIFEWDIGNLFDITVCVTANKGIRRKRLMARDGRSAEEIDGMFSAQLPEDVKMMRADVAIANNGSLERLRLFGKMLSSLTEIR